jgi:hypothetical protein
MDNQSKSHSALSRAVFNYFYPQVRKKLREEGYLL